MKIRRLDLIAYGPFTNEILDFESDALQIIYGPNEAGKSTALRALQAVLYGMTEKSDAFIHPWDLMRLGMSVEIGNEIIRIERRKGKGKRELAQSDDQLNNWFAALKAALLGLGEPADGRHDELTLRARNLVQAATDIRTRKRDLELDERRLEREHLQAERELSDRKRELADWKRSWSSATEGLPVAAEAVPAAVLEVVSLLDEVAAHAEKINGLVHRIDAMVHDEGEFSAEVARISEKAGFAPDSSDAIVIIKRLNQESSAAKRDEDSAAQLGQDIQRAQNALRIAQVEIERQKKALDALCLEAGVNDPDFLRAAIENAARKRGLETQIADQKKSLAGACAGGSLDELIEAVKEVNLDAVPGQVKELESRQRHYEEQREEFARRVIELERDFELHECAAALSQAATEKQDAEARILNYAEQYLEQEIAARLISAAIERYRTRHQDPLLDRAGQYLKDLTCGSFSGLVVDFENGNSRVLRALRRDTGQHVDITGMSDGARDQLFFALRLAYIEDYCTRVGPCPVILDDVLMAFDNDRAVAALRSLAALAKKTQVLLFTHHSHHRDLALQELGRNAVIVHDLTASNTAPVIA